MVLCEIVKPNPGQELSPPSPPPPMDPRLVSQCCGFVFFVLESGTVRTFCNIRNRGFFDSQKLLFTIFMPSYLFRLLVSGNGFSVRAKLQVQ